MCKERIDAVEKALEQALGNVGVEPSAALGPSENSEYYPSGEHPNHPANLDSEGVAVLMRDQSMIAMALPEGSWGLASRRRAVRGEVFRKEPGFFGIGSALLPIDANYRADSSAQKMVWAPRKQDV